MGWLHEAGYEVLLTARDLSQTHALLRLHGLRFTPVGGHGAGSTLRRAGRSAGRALSLARWARGRGIALALGHGSRGQALAARLLGIPAVTFVDYEYVSMKLFGLCCRAVFVPEAVPPEVLARRGVPERRLVSYPGYKEQVYLDPARDRRHPVDPPVILLRPPARLAHYHTARSERSYRRLLRRLGAEAGACRVSILPRYASDREDLAPLLAQYPHFEITDAARDGRELVLEASLVLSGGGTMIREAAVLGVPAASFFGGPVGGVDRALAEAGRLTLLRDDASVDALALPGCGGEAPAPGPIPDSEVVRRFLREQVFRLLDG